jgi:serine/threonine-protein kinase
MEPTRTEQIEELFAAAHELPVAEREAWLEREIADPGQRAEVRELLAAADWSGLLDRPLPTLAALAAAADEGPPPASLVGRRFGAYHLEELIGQGGSAAVYRAAREIGGTRQTVAVKILRRGLHAEEEHRLFLREQQLLARLEHPEIARWIDGGVTPEGIPFLVVEYVEGEPLTVACDRRRMSRRERLTLFVRLCRAVRLPTPRSSCTATSSHRTFSSAPAASSRFSTSASPSSSTRPTANRASPPPAA